MSNEELPTEGEKVWPYYIHLQYNHYQHYLCTVGDVYNGFLDYFGGPKNNIVLHKIWTNKQIVPSVKYSSNYRFLKMSVGRLYLFDVCDEISFN